MFLVRPVPWFLRLGRGIHFEVLVKVYSIIIRVDLAMGKLLASLVQGSKARELFLCNFVVVW